MHGQSNVNPARLVCAGFDGLEVPAEFQDVLDRGIGGVILFSRNAGTPGQVRDLCLELRQRSPGPLVICIDQEGGRCQRLVDGFNRIPSMEEVGRNGLDEVRRIAGLIADDLIDVGIDLDLAPVVDVNSNPDNPVIGSRSFGADPSLVSIAAAEFIGVMQSRGVSACAKHFPGHGDTDLDSHHDLPVLAHDMERLRQIELPPFKAAIEAGVRAVMTAHVLMERLDHEHPATLSPLIIKSILRSDLGYDGLVISDDLEMKAIADRYPLPEAALLAVEAGVDLLLCCHEHDSQLAIIDALEGAVHSGRLESSSINRSIERIDGILMHRPDDDAIGARG
ncbi:MAG: beta-N-acetylhexosaminidase [Phycisphaerae bacterium]|nr:beta-N-acetylhexosaminidase [Phycisphaerae bacterium]